jgi:hypothetical protein
LPALVDHTIRGRRRGRKIFLSRGCGAFGAAWNDPIRADGTAEIIHFQDVTATDAGTYVLSTLLRGRRGTEVYVSQHEPGEMFVMLDDIAATLRRLLPLDRVGEGPCTWRPSLEAAMSGTASPRQSSWQATT